MTCAGKRFFLIKRRNMPILEDVRLEADLVKTILNIATVMGVGILYFWAGVPTGVAFKFPVILSGLLTMAGAELGVIIVIVLGKPLQEWVNRKFEKQLAKMKSGKVMKIWDKYGVIGLGLLAPFLLGSFQCALLGLLLGAKPSRMLLWATMGVIVCGSVVTAIVGFGLEGAATLLKHH
jgi:hypothetical protein